MKKLLPWLCDLVLSTNISKLVVICILTIGLAIKQKLSVVFPATEFLLIFSAILCLSSILIVTVDNKRTADKIRFFSQVCSLVGVCYFWTGNFWLAGLPFVIIGLCLNQLAQAVNGFQMPVLEADKDEHLRRGGYKAINSKTRLIPICDIIGISFMDQTTSYQSIGDLFIYLGAVLNFLVIAFHG